VASRRGRSGARRLAIIRSFVAAQIIAGLVIGARLIGALQPVELLVHDLLVRSFAGHLASPPGIVLVTATESDLDRFGWPLPDDILAALLARLAAARAGPIGVDIYRDRAVPPGSDSLAAVQVALPALYWVRKLPEAGRPGVPAPPLLVGTPGAVLADNVVDAGEVVRRALLAAEDPDTGAIVRTLGAALAERASGQRFRPHGDGLALGDHPIPLVEPAFGPYAHADDAGYQMLLDFRGGRTRFPRLTLAEVIDSRDADLAAKVRGKAVLIGSETISVRDTLTTPLTTGLRAGPSLPGVEVHAHVADQLLRLAAGQHAGLQPALSRNMEGVVIWLSAMAGAFIPLVAGAGLATAPVLLVALAILVGGTAAAFGVGLLLPGGPALIAFAGAAGFAAWLLQGANRRERLRLRRAFEHYLDPRIIGAIAEEGADPGLDGAEREITAMFTDLAGFTTTSEELPAPALAALLNTYFEGLCDAVIAQGGLVVSFMGDGMLALFGAPLAQPDHADRAVRAALAIDAFARAFEAKQASSGVRLGVTRIGLHSGRAMVGNLGTRTRLQYGAIGDVLNTASRLEGMNKELGTRICLSSATVALTTQGRFRSMGHHAVRGRAGEIEVLVPDR